MQCLAMRCLWIQLSWFSKKKEKRKKEFNFLANSYKSETQRELNQP